MADYYDSDEDSIFEGFDESDLAPRAREDDSDSDIEVSSVSSVDSPNISDVSDDKDIADEQWSNNFTNFRVSFIRIMFTFNSIDSKHILHILCKVHYPLLPKIQYWIEIKSYFVIGRSFGRKNHQHNLS